MLGSSEAFDDQRACDMPIELQCQRLETLLRDRGACCFTVANPELHELDGDDRNVALDAIVEGAPGPYVLVEGRLVCSGTIDAEAVYSALR